MYMYSDCLFVQDYEPFTGKFHTIPVEVKDDKRYIAVIAVFAAVIALTIIRALFDETVAAQIRTLKFSAADGIVFTAALFGYLFIKKRGRK